MPRVGLSNRPSYAMLTPAASSGIREEYPQLNACAKDFWSGESGLGRKSRGVAETLLANCFRSKPISD